MPGTASKNKRRLWIAGGLLLAALTVLLLLPGDRKDSRVAVNDGVGTIWITPIADLPVNSFARSDFIQDDAGTAYTGGAYTASQGVDVSEWQKEIQWQEVAAGGIDFAVLRCGFRRYVSGNLEQDASFEANYAGAGEAGLRRGVYFFSQAVTPEEARAEAAYVLEMLDGRPLELPVFYDWETVSSRGGPGQRTGRRDGHRLCGGLLPGYSGRRLPGRGLLQPANGLSYLRPGAGPGLGLVAR